MLVFPLDAGFTTLSEGALVSCWQKGIIHQIKESPSEMEASQALTYKLLKTHVLSNANEMLIEQAAFANTHTRKTRRLSLMCHRHFPSLSYSW